MQLNITVCVPRVTFFFVYDILVTFRKISENIWKFNLSSADLSDLLDT